MNVVNNLLGISNVIEPKHLHIIQATRNKLIGQLLLEQRELIHKEIKHPEGKKKLLKNSYTFIFRRKNKKEPLLFHLSDKQVHSRVFISCNYENYLLENKRARIETKTEREFLDLVREWRDETEMLSSVTKKVIHPAYQRIIGMGRPVVPLILRELSREPDHWFWALSAITGVDPISSKNNFEEAVEAWLRWGRSKGFI